MDNLQKLREISDSLLDPDLAVRLFEDAADAIVVVKFDGTIFLVNRQAEFLFGYHRSELYDRPVHILVPEALREVHTKHVEGYVTDPHLRPMGLGIDLKGLKKDGKEFPAEINLSPLITQQGSFVAATIRIKR